MLAKVVQFPYMARRFVYYFLIYGFLGWCIDTAFRSALVYSYAPGTAIPFFSVVFASGALVILELNDHIKRSPLLVQFLAFAFACTMVEYIGGLIGIQVTGHPLWDYSSEAYNLSGMIDLFHTASWGLLALLMVRYIHPAIKRIIG